MSPNLQYTIIALTCLGVVLANQEILLAFIFRKTNWIKHIKLQLKNKEETTERQRLLKMQQPTPEAIKEQVSAEVDKQLPDKVCLYALKTPSFNKNKKKK